MYYSVLNYVKLFTPLQKIADSHSSSLVTEGFSFWLLIQSSVFQY